MAWTGKHTKVLIMTHRGAKDAEIAQDLGISIRTISRMRAKDDFIKKLGALETQIIASTIKPEKEMVDHLTRARELLKKNAWRAAKVVIATSKRGRPGDRLKYEAAKDILDRAGLKPKEELEIRERTYSPEELSSMKITLSEIESTTLRLSNTGSRFVLGPITMSSVTDKGSDGQDPQETSLSEDTITSPIDAKPTNTTT